jgi:trimeric autotransporter adhesin
VQLAGDALDVGVENVALGYASLTTDTKGNYSTAIGTFALAAQNFTSVTSAFNTGVGYGAGSSLQTGVQNTLIGAQAGDALNGASSYNTAAGYSALSSDTLGARSTAFGHEALATQNFTSSYCHCEYSPWLPSRKISKYRYEQHACRA